MNRIRLLPFVFVLLTACAETKPPTLRALGEKVTVDSTRPDEAIGFEVRKRIDAAGVGDLAGVIVEVENGVVTLRGSTMNRSAAFRAEGAARSVAGVKNVINAIQTGSIR